MATWAERVERKLRKNIYLTLVFLVFAERFAPSTWCQQRLTSPQHIANNCILKFLLCPFICIGSIFLASFLHGHVDTFHLHIAYLPALHIFNTQQARWIRTFIRFLGRSASGQMQIQHRHQKQLHQSNLGRRVTGWRLGEKSRKFRWELETSYCTNKHTLLSWLVDSQAKNMLDDITILFPQATTCTNPSLDCVAAKALVCGLCNHWETATKTTEASRNKILQHHILPPCHVCKIKTFAIAWHPLQGSWPQQANAGRSVPIAHPGRPKQPLGVRFGWHCLKSLPPSNSYMFL